MWKMTKKEQKPEVLVENCEVTKDKDVQKDDLENEIEILKKTDENLEEGLWIKEKVQTYK